MKIVDFASAAGVCCSCRKPISAARTLGNWNLTRREMQLVDLICQAKLNKEIAYQLRLSEGTVKEYLYRLYRKVGVTNRTELVILALTRSTRTASAA